MDRAESAAIRTKRRDSLSTGPVGGPLAYTVGRAG
jgi:hypothetical protein